MDSRLDMKQVIQSIGCGVALVDPANWELVFENARFFDWFPPSGEDEGRLPQRLAGFDTDKAAQRLQQRGKYSTEAMAHSKGRELPVRIECRHLSMEGQDLYLIEAQDISKEKETQFMLDSYSRLAEKKNKEVEKEKERVERLLLNIMPRQVYEELKDFGTTTPQRFDKASILVLDFVRFTEMTISKDASALVSELNDIFSAFDRIVEMFGCERIRTIGDSYLAVSGIPEESSDHTRNIARVAVRMRRYLEKRNAAHPTQWRCRIGINTGTVIGSLVGIQKYVYDLFGPGVNLACRMESLSEPMRITVNQATYELIKEEFAFIPRGEVEVKGFGIMPLYFLEEELKRSY
ncbi:adenylate/guanylate cyclase domain-containing protein [Aestuariirhabdus litorea]|uniref:Adenylate/guanylate cyclase domain-containing protein n=1 Tax=Aestuariirhabdus litorea TaxID=2528527 RepID=A0A3P3VJW6_9GAMM|nr:adenylate/guanylate cyclase domain-containing protein [Aestuariirhabdus litorea]RRJ83021.1 adenylate/guanylate cyclase domain-containing protein [Aestuariirhabdus litorea]RWW93179.1 adenylate/guanylate cyclase domain-containing protein [Endozoicomonadaceae bacterium GTF-13]